MLGAPPPRRLRRPPRPRARAPHASPRLSDEWRWPSPPDSPLREGARRAARRGGGRDGAVGGSTPGRGAGGLLLCAHGTQCERRGAARRPVCFLGVRRRGVDAVEISRVVCRRGCPLSMRARGRERRCGVSDVHVERVLLKRLTCSPSSSACGIRPTGMPTAPGTARALATTTGARSGTRRTATPTTRTVAALATVTTTASRKVAASIRAQ